MDLEKSFYNNLCRSFEPSSIRNSPKVQARDHIKKEKLKNIVIINGIMFCQKRLRNISRMECNFWSCKYWVGNGGICIPKFEDVEESYGLV